MIEMQKKIRRTWWKYPDDIFEKQKKEKIPSVLSSAMDKQKWFFSSFKIIVHLTVGRKIGNLLH